MAGAKAVAPTSNDVQRRAKQTAQRLPATFEQTARALERSAVLAEDHAEREEQAGRHDAAAKERLVADQAREVARRTRAHIESTPLTSASDEQQERRTRSAGWRC